MAIVIYTLFFRLVLHFAPLGICDFVVSSRLAIKRLPQRVLCEKMTSSGLSFFHTLKGMYARMLLVVERERDKIGGNNDRFVH